MPGSAYRTWERERHLADIVATELWRKKLAWYSWQERRWFVRESTGDAWVSRRGFAPIRDHLVMTELETLYAQEPYSSWREIPGLLSVGTRYYRVLHRMKWVWRDWGVPEEGLPR